MDVVKASFHTIESNKSRPFKFGNSVLRLGWDDSPPDCEVREERAGESEEIESAGDCDLVDEELFGDCGRQ